jgi:DNA primase
MVNAAGHVVEIRLRFPDGRKLAVTGGREGLFIPDGLDYSGPLILAEGPTDCAALLDLGFPALGRPSCSGSVRHCVELVRAHWPLDVVVIADGDPPGQRGAEVLASMLLAYAQTVRVIRPPDEIKDARAWKQAGATAADIRTLIAGAPSRRLSIKGVCHD